MRGRIKSLWVVTFFGLGVVWACAPALPYQPSSVRAGSTVEAAHVVVVKSGDNPLFTAPVSGFISTLSDVRITVFTRAESGSSDDSLGRALQAAKPDLVFSLGTRASLLARGFLPDTPQLFAMVVNHHRLTQLASDSVSGVAMESSPVTEFMQFRMVAPATKRVLAFYSPGQGGVRLEACAKQLSVVGVELVAVEADGPDSVVAGYAANHGSVDALWYMNDPVIMQPKIFDYLRKQTVVDRLPFLSSLSESFAKAGAFAAVSIDSTALGSQVASMARRILRGEATPSQLGVQDPIGNTLTVNLGVAEAIDLVISDDVMPMINNLIVSKKPTSP